MALSCRAKRPARQENGTRGVLGSNVDWDQREAITPFGQYKRLKISRGKIRQIYQVLSGSAVVPTQLYSQLVPRQLPDPQCSTVLSVVRSNYMIRRNDDSAATSG